MCREKYLAYMGWVSMHTNPAHILCLMRRSGAGTRWAQLGRPFAGSTKHEASLPDMVIPIAPNQVHRPIHPTPSFLFSNCFDCFPDRKSVRVRIHEGGPS